MTKVLGQKAARLPKPLERLEAEAIEIMRDVVAELKRPIMLYSIGKDSSVTLHLAVKAFYPAPSPFPLLQGRLIDSDETASMERKKREGYF